MIIHILVYTYILVLGIQWTSIICFNYKRKGVGGATIPWFYLLQFSLGRDEYFSKI